MCLAGASSRALLHILASLRNPDRVRKARGLTSFHLSAMYVDESAAMDASPAVGAGAAAAVRRSCEAGGGYSDVELHVARLEDVYAGDEERRNAAAAQQADSSASDARRAKLRTLLQVNFVLLRPVRTWSTDHSRWTYKSASLELAYAVRKWSLRLEKLRDTPVPCRHDRCVTSPPADAATRVSPPTSACAVGDRCNRQRRPDRCAAQAAAVAARGRPRLQQAGHGRQRDPRRRACGVRHRQGARLRAAGRHPERGCQVMRRLHLILTVPGADWALEQCDSRHPWHV